MILAEAGNIVMAANVEVRLVRQEMLDEIARRGRCVERITRLNEKIAFGALFRGHQSLLHTTNAPTRSLAFSVRDVDLT